MLVETQLYNKILPTYTFRHQLLLNKTEPCDHRSNHKYKKIELNTVDFFEKIEDLFRGFFLQSTTHSDDQMMFSELRHKQQAPL